METSNVNGYEVAGNDYLAIVINEENEKDTYIFTPKLGEDGLIESSALTRAYAWVNNE